ncbi:MAG: hypothetical protein HY544_04255 [Candidatus Diapherotrites archaeon]|uniref:Methyltransferase domain-containing protein n=1 Tax=Candidatus Iainarchaeum sp. TaxID=3101447 RepID=A0A8T3YLW3_9ARCH|nr:hypothetical protein [Candidatus Diapherotrites archaeon]
MKSNATGSFPRLRRMIRRAEPWKISGRARQTYIPADEKLAEKIGIAQNDKIIVFAGGAGQWASELSKFADVRYTDISPSMASHAKLNMTRIRTVRVAPAELVPSRERIYDWSFSFEPFQLMDPRHGMAIKVAILRALTNNKGAKLVFGPLLFKKNEESFRKIPDIYGATTRISKTGIMCMEHSGETKENRFTVIDILTNDSARNDAKVDIRIMRLLDREYTQGKRPTIQDIAEKTNIESGTVERSLERLHKINSMRWI